MNFLNKGCDPVQLLKADNEFNDKKNKNKNVHKNSCSNHTPYRAPWVVRSDENLI